MSVHPYKNLPDKAFWKRSVGSVAPGDIDPVGRFDLIIMPETKVATAGSCFAQHIARHLKASGFSYYVAEKAHPIIPADVASSQNYGLFSARYGNIYTARQLLQLIQRSTGSFTPSDDVWTANDGSFIDPFRPSTQPGGYISKVEMLADRDQHLRIVREMFENLDVFVFTLGLTEGWVSKADGAAYPIAPGVEGGVFNPDLYAFKNYDVNEVLGDMNAFLDHLRLLNPAAEVILTVSPVPLAATAEPDQHVLSATTYSKSVLRVVAEMLAKQHRHVHYFPSFEIITGMASRGAYYAHDLRNVTEEGVSHVMRIFLSHATATETARPSQKDKVALPGDFVELSSKIAEALCDEEKLDA
ncbi:MAG: GSCFA domain-containing protein [Pseudomonadota bacterium]|uniref:GSCFA domain-containing protein n=1 Tax=Brevundimonas vesicularis TaxID=41276 RepID=UPI0022ABCC94|nr:GSCFA domain-containing protein [Brevundimonas vesicularis]